VLLSRTPPKWDIPAMRDEVLAILNRSRSELEALGVRFPALFGSTARDEASAESDVDLLVDLEPATFDRYMDVKILLEDRVGRRVDLVTRRALMEGARADVERMAIRVV
jgi:predicted nucleotidyltransferase